MFVYGTEIASNRDTSIARIFSMKRMIIEKRIEFISAQECEPFFEFEVFSIREFVVILVKMFMEIHLHIHRKESR